MIDDPGSRQAAPTRPGLSVVVVAFRSPELLAQAVRSLAASTQPPDQVVAVDADPRGPAPLIVNDVTALTSLPTEVLQLPDNPGYAAACNRGLAATTGSWVLFMNADVSLSEDCLGRVMAEATAADDIGVATCRLMMPDGRIDHACHRGIPSPLESLAYKVRLHRLIPGSRRLGHYTLSWLDTSTVHDVEACSGAFMLVRREALESIGAWDERYWFYAEDLDLCLRLASAGWRIRYVGTATAQHVKGASSHLRRRGAELTQDERAVRRRVRRAVVDSHERFYREHQEASTTPLLRPLITAMFRLQRLRMRMSG